MKHVCRGLCCDIVLGDEMGFSIVNKLKTFVLKINDTQLGEDGIDTWEDTWKGDGDSKLCWEKYNSERKQIILSQIKLEDNAWIDIFQAGAIDVSCEGTHCRGYNLIMSLLGRKQIYCTRKEVISNLIIGRIASTQEEWVIYRFGWYMKLLPIILWKQEGKDERGKGIFCW